MTARVAGLVLAVSLVISTTAGCSSSPTESPLGCPLAVIEGFLEPLGPPGSIGIMEGPNHLILSWHDGFHPAEVNGALVVLSPDGTVVARVGDLVQVTGASIKAGEWFS
jgi:hypothetical protein